MFWSPFLIGLLLGFLGIWGAVKFFPLLGLLDFPERYGLTRDKIPYPGGLIFWILGLSFFLLHKEFWILSLPLFLLGVLSFWDDRVNLPAQGRLLAHIGIAIFLFFLGVQITFIGNPFAATNFEIAEHFPRLAFLITVAWIVAIQNAMNWFDGLPGLAPGVSGVGFLALGILGLWRPELFLDPTHASLTGANFFLAGACLGGFYCFWKKKIILGDTGSQVLGFLLAVMAIFSGAKIATTLLVLALPLLDFVFVIARRVLLEKKSPFQGDLHHLHHNLAAQMGEKRAVLLLVVLSALLGTISIFLVGMAKVWGLLGAGVFVLGLCVWGFRKKGFDGRD